MSYSIIGFGDIGQALARMFAGQGLEVAVAATRPPEALADQARAIGPRVIPQTLAEAIRADTLLLAMPYRTQRDVARAAPDWTGKTLVDVTNAYGVLPEELDGRASSAVLADAFPGAKLVKAFNHLPSKILNKDPAVNGGRRVAFLASDHDDAADEVAKLVDRLGFAPVKLGALEEGGRLVQARGQSWAPLIFQDLVKFG